MSRIRNGRVPDSKEKPSQRAADVAITVTTQAFLRLCAALPRRVLHFLAACAGWLAWPFRTTTRKITERNIAIAFPDLPSSEQRHLAKASFRQLFHAIADIGPTWLPPVERVLGRISRVIGEEHLRESMTENRGVIVILPHLGNWELIGLYLAARYPMTSLFKAPKVAAVHDIVLRARQRNGNRLVPTNASGVRALMKALKSRELATILPDQLPPRESGEFAPFFGEPALTMTLVTRLITRCNSKAVLAYATLQPDNSYQLVFRPAEEGIYSSDPATALIALNKSVEQCVLDCPEQYRWEYKRFKYLPDMSRRESY
ncbi:MAG: lysophospholipid acyltransferase family protein [Gammaproteobacteria bacterium]|nr:lysophospholipid acyltransferase family protein [Gammaproteobacteria bacterium]